MGQKERPYVGVNSIHGNDSKDQTGHTLVHWSRELLLIKYITYGT